MLRPYDPFAIIDVKNESGKEIQRLEIKHHNGMVEITGLRAGDTTRLAFYVPGETSYSISASFPDGTIATGGVGYIQSGYHGTDTVFSNMIESKYGSAD